MLDLHDRLTCRECGGWAADCRSEDTAGRWQIHMSVCQSSAVVEEFRAAHSEDLEAGTVLFARLLPEGEMAYDPLDYNPERARRAYEEQQKRLGLVEGG